MGLTGKRRAACQSGPLLRSPLGSSRHRPAPVAIRNALSGVYIPSTGFCSRRSLFQALARPSPGSRELLARRSDKGAPPLGWAAGGSVVANLHCPC